MTVPRPAAGFSQCRPLDFLHSDIGFLPIRHRERAPACETVYDIVALRSEME
jgi:hypothetical protein